LMLRDYRYWDIVKKLQSVALIAQRLGDRCRDEFVMILACQLFVK